MISNSSHTNTQYAPKFGSAFTIISRAIRNAGQQIAQHPGEARQVISYRMPADALELCGRKHPKDVEKATISMGMGFRDPLPSCDPEALAQAFRSSPHKLIIPHSTSTPLSFPVRGDLYRHVNVLAMTDDPGAHAVAQSQIADYMELRGEALQQGVRGFHADDMPAKGQRIGSSVSLPTIAQQIEANGFFHTVGLETIKPPFADLPKGYDIHSDLARLTEGEEFGIFVGQRDTGNTPEGAKLYVGTKDVRNKVGELLLGGKLTAEQVNKRLIVPPSQQGHTKDIHPAL